MSNQCSMYSRNNSKSKFEFCFKSKYLCNKFCLDHIKDILSDSNLEYRLGIQEDINNLETIKRNKHFCNGVNQRYKTRCQNLININTEYCYIHKK